MGSCYQRLTMYPPQYQQRYCDEIVGLGRQGYHVYEMGMHFNVTKKTLYNWAKKHPEFAVAFDTAVQYSKAYYQCLLRENSLNRDLNPHAFKFHFKFFNEFKEDANVKMPMGFAKMSAGDQCRAVMQELENGELSAAEAEKLINLIKVGLSVEQEVELAPMLEKLTAAVAAIISGDMDGAKKEIHSEGH